MLPNCTAVWNISSSYISGLRRNKVLFDKKKKYGLRSPQSAADPYLEITKIYNLVPKNMFWAALQQNQVMWRRLNFNTLLFPQRDLESQLSELSELSALTTRLPQSVSVLLKRKEDQQWEGEGKHQPCPRAGENFALWIESDKNSDQSYLTLLERDQKLQPGYFGTVISLVW